jgi:LacI family transcriptional regulator
MVFFDRICPELPTSRVIVDDKEGARLGVQHLIDIGCKRIAHLRGPDGLVISENRFQGYMEALEANGLHYDEDLVVVCDDSSVDQSILVTKKLLELDQRPDGIFAWHDVCAMGAMKATFKSGLKVPDDIAIVGFSDWQFAALVHPSLTSIHQSGFEMGQAAARLFIEQVGSKSSEFVPKTEVVPTRLVIRDSTSR